MAKHADGSQALVGAAGGSVQSVPGVDVCGSTSHAAEGVGALWALLWIIAAVHDEGFPLVSHCRLVSDSAVTVGAVDGSMSGHAEPVLARRLREVQLALQ